MREPEITADWQVPDGFMLVRSGDVQGVTGTGAELLAEDLRSLGESSPYLVRFHEGTAPQPCECCGAPLTFVPEALCAGAGGEPPEWRRWKPGAWEAGAGRRHTLRRCEWLRASRLAAGAGRAAPGPS